MVTVTCHAVDLNQTEKAIEASCISGYAAALLKLLHTGVVAKARVAKAEDNS